MAALINRTFDLNTTKMLYKYMKEHNPLLMFVIDSSGTYSYPLLLTTNQCNALYP